MLIVKCSEHTGRSRYTDIAMNLYGEKGAKITSFLYLINLIGFTFSKVTYVKKAIPTILALYIDPDKMGWLVKGYDDDSVSASGIFWGFCGKSTAFADGPYGLQEKLKEVGKEQGFP